MARLGRFWEAPGEVLRVASDDETDVLTIDYQATVYEEEGATRHANVKRRLRIPYGRLDLFYQCSIDCSSLCRCSL